MIQGQGSGQNRPRRSGIRAVQAPAAVTLIVDDRQLVNA